MNDKEIDVLERATKTAQELHEAIVNLETALARNNWSEQHSANDTMRALGLLSCILDNFMPQRLGMLLRLAAQTFGKTRESHEALAEGMTDAAMQCPCLTCPACKLREADPTRARASLLDSMRNMLGINKIVHEAGGLVDMTGKPFVGGKPS